MADKQSGVIIATRNLLLKNKNSQSGVRVSIFQPHAEADGEVWGCEYRVEGLSRLYGRVVKGSDSLQALVLAVKSASIDICSSTEGREGLIYWHDMASDEHDLVCLKM